MNGREGGDFRQGLPRIYCKVSRVINTEGGHELTILDHQKHTSFLPFASFLPPLPRRSSCRRNQALYYLSLEIESLTYGWWLSSEIHSSHGSELLSLQLRQFSHV